MVAAAATTKEVAVYRVMMLGGPGVGKTALTQQFVTSEYIAAQNTSFDDGITIPVPILLEGEESVVEFIDLPYNGELNTWRDYDVDGYVIVYSITDRRSYQKAIDLLYAIKADVANTKPIILAANKSDLERSRVIGKQEGRTVAETYACKYIDVSAILNHRVDELLVGVLKQVRLRREGSSGASARKSTAADGPSSSSGCGTGGQSAAATAETPPRSPFRRRALSRTRRTRDDSCSTAVDISCFSSSSAAVAFVSPFSRSARGSLLKRIVRRSTRRRHSRSCENLLRL
jgi:Rad/Gem-related GTP binding protein 1